MEKRRNGETDKGYFEGPTLRASKNETNTRHQSFIAWAYVGIAIVSFTENFAYILKEWIQIITKWGSFLHYKMKVFSCKVRLLFFDKVGHTLLESEAGTTKTIFWRNYWIVRYYIRNLEIWESILKTGSSSLTLKEYILTWQIKCL